MDVRGETTISFVSVKGGAVIVAATRGCESKRDRTWQLRPDKEVRGVITIKSRTKWHAWRRRRRRGYMKRGRACVSTS